MKLNFENKDNKEMYLNFFLTQIMIIFKACTEMCWFHNHDIINMKNVNINWLRLNHT